MLLLLALSSQALKLPTVLSRRAALALPVACALPLAAEAKYRASLAEMKGYGGSPVVDQMKESSTVSTALSFEQLVNNSKKQQEEMLGREMNEEELKALKEKIRKFYPTAK